MSRFQVHTSTGQEYPVRCRTLETKMGIWSAALESWVDDGVLGGLYDAADLAVDGIPEAINKHYRIGEGILEDRFPDFSW